MSRDGTPQTSFVFRYYEFYCLIVYIVNRTRETYCDSCFCYSANLKSEYITLLYM